MDFSGLNDQQKRIVLNGDGVVVVNAGPGTGKTKTLTSRVAFLIGENGVDPQNILTLTFTQRASLEMRERLQKILGKNKLPLITTFHGFAYDFLIRLGQEVEIISEENREMLVKKIIKENKSRMSFRDLSLVISRYKNSLNSTQKDHEIEKLFKDYQKALVKKQLLDFDDLLLKTWKILKDDSNQRVKLQEQYQYVLIDEFQDTNDLQYQIIRLILKENPNLFVIGDPLQSIYGFRGASAKIFEKLHDDFPDTKTAFLEINYRSKSSIVNISNQLFSNTNLKSFSRDLGNVAMIDTLNEYSEAGWIVSFINNKIGGTDLNSAQKGAEGANFADFAVIYRTHHLAYVLEKKFNESGLPYQIVREDTPVEGDHIKLLSMHAAKGLEFKYVFICGFEDGLIPYRHARGEFADDLEEEKRLLYVAMTRAKDELYLICAKSRNKKYSKASMFKQNIKSNYLVEMEDQAIGKILQKRQALKIKKSQMSLF
ncbi:MAG: ATP-dependent helicase [Patescibacteria group bacterium]|nr:ATP-dependent helicase [Patescibacteria group bacterium]